MTLDPGLVACAVIAALGIVGVCLWLYAAGHLDQIEDVRRAPAARRRTGTRRPHSRVPSSHGRDRIRAARHEWTGR